MLAMRCRPVWLPMIALGMMCGLAEAATLHLVLVPDTRDPVIGKDMEVNANELRSTFESNVPADRLNGKRSRPEIQMSTEHDRARNGVKCGISPTWTIPHTVRSAGGIQQEGNTFPSLLICDVQ